MTTLRAFDTKQLAALKDTATALYQQRESGYAEDFTATPNANGNFPRKMFHGAITTIVAQSLELALVAYEEHRKLGYTLAPVQPLTTTLTYCMIHVLKPVAHPKDGNGKTTAVVDTQGIAVPTQTQELKLVHADVEAAYRASVDAHNTDARETLMAARLQELEHQDELARRQEAAAVRAKRRAELAAQIEAELSGAKTK
ncbi:hypothetical protein [Pseudomonas simiae]|uniref:hypothetical protein n=1 Tax=Pseudomonas simiae TaxID=321846 RepID=UPI0016541E15|nr:hypothetical protein [Pseudomonas simiae]MBC3965351.1 hypothetical protein [Pseudomonas simiae]